MGLARTGSRKARFVTMALMTFTAFGGLLVEGRMARAGEVQARGLTLRLPQEWSRQEAADATPPGLCATEEEAGVACIWVRETDGRTLASLNVAVSPEAMDVSETGQFTTRAAVKSALRRSSRHGRRYSLDRLSLVDLNGAAAYRVEVTTETPTGRLRQLQYVVSGTRTHVLTFCAEADVYARQVGLFEDIARSARWERRRGQLEQMSPAACGIILGLCLGLSLGARQLRRRGSSEGLRSTCRTPLGSRA